MEKTEVPSALSYPEAAELVAREAAQLAAPRRSERVELSEAQDQVLAEDVVADRDQPPFARSTRDGFAASAAGWSTGSVRVRGLLRAGEDFAGEPLGAGECVEIMTGAPVPPGADCVLMVEHARRTGDAVQMLPGRTLSRGANIVPAGAEAAAGAVLLAAGTRLSVAGVGAAAACGWAQLRVWARPRVAILATGDELVAVEESPLPHQIRNANSSTLAAQVRAAGGEPWILPPVADEAEALAKAIAEAAGQAELLLLSGGVSMGRYDLVEPALAALGGRFHFTGVRMQPGRPVVFGALGEGAVPFFGLPGNPVSTLVCFALFGAPVLAALAGEQGFALPFAQARLRGVVRNEAGLTRFLPARLGREGFAVTVETIPWQGSGDLAATSRANCFLVAEEQTSYADGDAVTVLLLR